MNTKTNIQEFLNRAYKAIYAQAPSIFPEFGFELMPHKNAYKSTTTHKVDGSTGDRKGAVYYYEVAPFGLKDYTRSFVTIYHYIQQRDKLESHEMLDRIAALSGLPFPKAQSSSENNLLYKQWARDAEILEAANTFFINCLSHKENEYAQSQQASELRSYLTEIRGYDASYLRLPENEYSRHSTKMELGYIPNTRKTVEYLKQQGFLYKEIWKVLKFPKGVGYSHFLSIPYRNRYGAIRGFAFRNIRHTNTHKTPKYLYSMELERGSILFNAHNTKNQKDITIVEGLLDALYATACGIPDVIALGGTELTNRQMERITKLSPSSITLCLDNDNAGQQGQNRAIFKILQHLPDVQLYTTRVSPPHKDLDELLRAKGTEKATELLNNAACFYKDWIVLLEEFCKKRQLSLKTDKGRHLFITEIQRLLQFIPKYSEQQQFKVLIFQKWEAINLKQYWKSYFPEQ